MLYKQLQEGKMLRSKLILNIINHELAYLLCAIIELIQSASLLHDDVIDESELRRGKPSLNAEFGNKNAIMLGDILYSRAFYELSKFHPLIAQNLSLSVSKLSIGELEDVFLEQKFNTNENEYLQMIEHKSADLIATSAQCAFLLKDCIRLDSKNPHNAQLDSATCNKAAIYYEYGLYLGMAFQIIDDILDITQDTQTLGKPTMRDFSGGKTTLPYIYLYHELQRDEQIWLQSLFKKDITHADKAKLHSLLLEKSLDKTKQKAQDYAKIAKQHAITLNNPKLESLIDSMIQRDF
ncbi:polyprenyl synthetase family protein [Helicobacter aurati]|uniref:Polyprenyl synthetase family protein n=2 Tax=Helicobacter aurati TaxID=137778 RepID=A0A3D8IZN9_9HELI|nr:polyprenyl synthetase family protein [Helicobacter aurati]